MHAEFFNHSFLVILAVSSSHSFLFLDVLLFYLIYAAKQKGISVDRVYTGSFMTSLEMAGVSITILHLDETRSRCLGEDLVKSCLCYD